MPKRAREVISEEGNGHRSDKRVRTQTKSLYRKVATAEAAAIVDKEPPFYKLLEVVKSAVKNQTVGDAIVYWMRMEDMRSTHTFPLFLGT